MKKLSEFDLISKYFAPLSQGIWDAPGESFGRSFGLSDDAAVLNSVPGQDWVVTKDAIVSGIHFLPDDPPDLIAKKLMRVNLSDLAAKGATPAHYLLAAAWPQDIEERWVAAFAQGLSEDQTKYGVSLLGGDTVSTTGPATFSLTAFGRVKNGGMLTRKGAEAGDRLCVSGTVGDAYLGLQCLAGGAAAPQSSDRDFLVSRYQLPNPRLDLLDFLRDHATATIDISDGLLADLDHLRRASGIGVRLDLASIPLSQAAKALVDRGAVSLDQLCGGGDDYEILFAVPKLDQLPATVTEIGEFIAKEGLWSGASVKDLVPLKPSGFSHF